ncbi:MAG: lamin tail domain-containing protein [Ardenticatenaceae bacterium]
MQSEFRERRFRRASAKRGGRTVGAKVPVVGGAVRRTLRLFISLFVVGILVSLIGTPSGSAWAQAASDVVVSEIMYHPSSGDPGDEFIELYNRGASAVSVENWAFTDGVAFTFPNVSIAANDYLVVAADVTAFQAKYPGITNVVGPWDGKLSNSGEKIELEDENGDRVAAFRYADEGPWAVRREGPLDFNHRGWIWEADHDGLGPSLELINPNLTYEEGHNWGSSTNNDGTPGQVNSILAADVAPVLYDLAHAPAVPSSSDSVVVRVKTADEDPSSLSVQLHYRQDGAGSFTTVAMNDAGLDGDPAASDGEYTVTLPPQADGIVVEFYVEATDGTAQSRTYPGPTDDFGAQEANALYQVDNGFAGTLPLEPSDEPVIRFVLTEAERAELTSIPNSPDQASKAQFNTTFIAVYPYGEVDVRYNNGVRVRGQGSRSMVPPNYRLNLRHDKPWNSVTRVNFNTQFPHSQVLGSAAFRRAEIASAVAYPLQLRINNQDPTNAGLPNFGHYNYLQVIDGDFASDQYPQLEDAAIYRGDRGPTPEQDGDLGWEGNDPNAYRDGYFKKTNEEEDDWSDLIALVDALNNAPEATYFNDVSQVADLEQWARFFAMDTLLGNREGSLGNGAGDDYYLIFGSIDRRARIIPHDLDTLLAQGDNQGQIDVSIFFAGRAEGLARLFSNSEWQALYVGTILEYLDTVYTPQVMNALIDETIGDFAPQANTDAMKQFVLDRRAAVLGEISQLNNEIVLGQNVAVGALASQSSTVYGGVASRAVDGNTNGVYSNGSVTHTNNDTNAWWEMDLGGLVDIDTIRLWNRTNCCSSRLSNFHLFVSDDPFTSTNLSDTQAQPGVSDYYFSGQAGTSETFNIARTGRYVRVQLGGTNRLSLAEVEVFASSTPAANFTLTGTANAHEVSRVLVNGLPANWRPRTGTWLTGGEPALWENLLAFGADWKYLDDGSDQETTWLEDEFDDNSWAEGPAPLGYGLGDEATVVSYGQSMSNKHATTYFRKNIQINDPSSIYALDLNLVANDGAVVYINGVEVARENVHPEYVSADEFADVLTVGLRATTPVRFRVTADMLRVGDNVIAVEVHQAFKRGDDLRFDLEIEALKTAHPALELSGGMNQIRVEYFDRDGKLLEADTTDLHYDTGSYTEITGTVTGPVTWTLADSPIRVTEEATITGGLIIEPGVTVFFDQYDTLTITGDVLIAEGNPYQRIWFGPTPGSSTSTAVLDAKEGLYIKHGQFEGEKSRAGVAELDSGKQVLVQDSYFSTRREDILRLIGRTSLVFRNNTLAPMFGDPVVNPGSDKEYIEGAGSIDNTFIIENNVFGLTASDSDIIDTIGDTLFDPIPQIRNNIVMGGQDEFIDGRGDYVVEGNFVMDVYDPTGGGCKNSNVLSLEGSDRRVSFTRNIFAGSQHLINNVNNSFSYFENNTIYSIENDSNSASAAIILWLSGNCGGYARGLGSYLAGNIWNDLPDQVFGEPDNNVVNLLEVRGDLVESASVFANADGVHGRSFEYDIGTAQFVDPNNGDYNLQAGSPGIGTGPFGLDMGAMVPRGAQISGEPSGISNVDSATLTIGGPGIFSFIYKVNDGPWSAPITIQDATDITAPQKQRSYDLQLTGLADGPNTVYVRGADMGEVYQPSIVESKTWTVATSPNIRLSEVLAENAGVYVSGAEMPDFIELVNDGPAAFDLSGYTISDDPTEPNKYTFPNGTTVGAGQYFVLDADGNTVDFKLSGKGEGVYLFDSAWQLVDSVEFGPQATDYTISRLGDTLEWGLSLPTPGAANTAQPLGEAQDLLINEWLANSGQFDDFVELYNPSSLPISLAGLYLTEVLIVPDQFQIVDLSFIAPQGTFDFTADNKTNKGPDHLNFKLDAEFGEIGLFDDAFNVIDIVLYGPQTEDVSQGILANDNKAVLNPTPGEANQALSANNAPTFTGGLDNQNATVGLPLTFTLTADDPDGDTLEYEISSGAQVGMTLDEETGEFAWTPISDHNNQTHVVHFSVTDNKGRFDYGSITITVDGEACPLLQEAENGTLSGGFEVGNDAAASGGQYVHVPNTFGNRFNGPDAAQKVEYCFLVDEAGTYRVKGWAYAATGLDNSFYVQVDGSPSNGNLWDFAKNTTYDMDYVSNRNGDDPVEVTLTPGLHFVSLFLREDGARLDQIELEKVDDTPPPTPTCDGLVAEGEAGVLTGDFVVGNDPLASGTQYVHVPNGSGNSFNSPNPDHMAQYCFEVDTAGTYRIKGSVYAESGQDDSFFVKVNDTPVSGYLWDFSKNSTYDMDFVSDRNGDDPIEVDLLAGDNFVTVFLREDGARLDKLELELVPTIPTPVCGALTAEAETGVLLGDFVIGNDPVASGSEYIHVPEGSGNSFNSPNPNHQAQYCFTVDTAGTYRIKGWTYADTGSDNSFFVQVNGTPANGYKWTFPINSSYQMDHVSDANGADPVEVTLPAGDHLVSIFLREDGARLDKLELELVTTTQNAPALLARGVAGTLLVSSHLESADNENENENENEIELEGITLTLLDAETGGQQYQETAHSNAIGQFYFDQLPIGEYLLQIQLPEGYTSTQPTEMTVTVDTEKMVQLSFDVQTTTEEAYTIYLPAVSNQ